ncbi:MAG: hypothetical protein GF317_09125 [Candidatus Lokiarchaeota archaeon]|nr:hypothetical protein [Candidatus Lokiarchaeota archaeon]
MANKNISENIEEAKNYLNSVEEMGMSALRVANRILDSNKVFVHLPEKQKEINETIDGILKDYENAKRDALSQINKEADSYEKHIEIANYLAQLELEKTQKLIAFWDRFNQKL